MPLCSDADLIPAPGTGCCSHPSLLHLVQPVLPGAPTCPGLHPTPSCLPCLPLAAPGVGWQPWPGTGFLEVISSGSPSSHPQGQKGISALLSPFPLPCWRAQPGTGHSLAQGRHRERCRRSSQGGRAFLAQGHCSHCTDPASGAGMALISPWQPGLG